MYYKKNMENYMENKIIIEFQLYRKKKNKKIKM